ncbi:MAG: polysaccharide deacetylase [Lachnospiraceae bacterium]|nr:polysaccharide deacetylase [Lachnospiraceae bacterium]
METMKEKNEDLERRKHRIKLIKRGIIITVVSVILIPIILSICLLFKVNSMQKQIDELYEIRENARQEEQLAIQRTQEESEEAELLASQLPQTAESEVPEEGTGEIRKKVYLTFDDGPSASTDEILNILKEYNVKATFFVVGKEDEHSLEMYQRIINEGHSLGMHSYSHQYSVIYQSVESFAQDIEKLEQLLKSATGEDIRLFRFPGGSSNMVSNIGMNEFIKYLKEQNITYFDWNVSSGDATNKSIGVDELVENVIKDVKVYDNSVVLMHDAANKHSTVEALPKMIEQLKEMDVEILSITSDVKPIQHMKAEEVE